jgi:tryptophan synthase beta chain
MGPKQALLPHETRCCCYLSYRCCAQAFQQLSQLEGIIPALETSHAIAYLDKLCPTLKGGERVVLNCSGRGDKDVNTVIKLLNM